MRRAALALAALALFAGAAVARDAHPKFRWPLIGKIAKAKDGHGVDIAVPLGEAVHAAGDGAVIYASDQLASFGKMIIIRHSDGYVTTYAHLSAIGVAQGAAVKRGQIIGNSGKTGDVNAPVLHFELRKGETSLDPLGYLSPR